MKCADTTNLVTLIDSADEHGRVCFYIPNNDPVRNKDQAREYLSTVFMRNHAVTVRLDRVKKFITEIDMELAPAGVNHTALTVNLAKLLLLPSIAPAEELAAYRAMLLELRAFYEAHPTEHCSVQMCNNRDRSKRVYGTIACRVPHKTEEHMAQQDEEATQSLRKLVEGNQALVYWLRQVALALQKLGPWASAFITEENLFGYSNGPYAKHLWQEILADAHKPKPAPEIVVPLDI
jgi:hypothetical protein